MIRLLLTKFWYVLIPVALYVLWFLYKRWKLRNSDEVVRIGDGPWVMTIIVTLILSAAGFLWLGILDPKTGPATYTPAILKDGKVIDGEVKSK